MDAARAAGMADLGAKTSRRPGRRFGDYGRRAARPAAVHPASLPVPFLYGERSAARAQELCGSQPGRDRLGLESVFGIEAAGSASRTSLAGFAAHRATPCEAGRR